MRAIFGLVLIIGVALAGFAVYMAQNYIGQSEQRLNAALKQQEITGKLIEVYALSKPLKYGDPLDKANVRKIWIQEKFAPAGVYKDEAVLFPPEATRPRFARRSIEVNEVLLSSRLTEPGQVAALTSKLEPGESAFQIQVSTNSGVASFVMPDDFIDIYWTGQTGDGEVTRLIENAVRVIAVDQTSDQTQRSDSAARTITVAATREGVARLTQAQSSGRLAMSLVQASAEAPSELIEIDRNKLLGIEEKVPEAVVEVAAPEVCTIRTRKGSEIIETPIACTN